MIEPSTPTRDCPNPEKWSARDSDTCEEDVLIFLTYLAGLIKPRLTIETGTCFGASAYYLAQESEKVLTCDPDDKDKSEFLPHNQVEYRQCRGTELISTEPIDLLFLDSDLNERVAEYFHFKPFLSDRAVVVIHDTGETHADFLAQVKVALKDELDFVILPTPRGLLIGRPKRI